MSDMIHCANEGRGWDSSSRTPCTKPGILPIRREVTPPTAVSASCGRSFPGAGAVLREAGVVQELARDPDQCGSTKGEQPGLCEKLLARRPEELN